MNLSSASWTAFIGTNWMKKMWHTLSRLWGAGFPPWKNKPWRVGQALGLILRVADPLVFKGPSFRLLVWVRRRGPALDDRVYRFHHVHVRVRCPRTAGLRDPAGQQVSDCLEPGFQIK